MGKVEKLLLLNPQGQSWKPGPLLRSRASLIVGSQAELGNQENQE